MKLALPAEEAGDVLTVGHLAEEVERVSGVPQDKQKMIFKGEKCNLPCLYFLRLAPSMARPIYRNITFSQVGVLVGSIYSFRCAAKLCLH